MQARIAALEAENRTLRKRPNQVASTRAAAIAPLTTPLAASSSAPTPRASVRPVDAMASAASSLWTGAYMGVSLGAGGMRASTSGSASTIIGTSTSASTFGGSSKLNAGAVADLYAGYTRQWGHWVGGVQGEASLGRIFNRFDQTVQNVNTNPPTIANATSTSANSLDLNFMVSALARAGYLIDPRNQIYGLAGWTFAGFNTTLTPGGSPGGAVFNSSSFGANGVTVGAGWEHQIADQWTLRAEYRYTKFENVTLGSFQLDSFTSIHAAATVAPDLQVVRVGLTRYFDVDVAPADTFTKAPAAYANSWTGAYAGMSLGLGGENTKATTNERTLTTSTGGGNISTISNNGLIAGDRQFGAGGNADLFIGYNKQINDWVGGVQFEGTLSRFNERLSRTIVNNFVDRTNGVGVPSQNSHSLLDTLSQNWAVTAAARLGRLVTPHDLVYGLAGWSFANFSTTLDSTGAGTFNTSGPTVGIGWERQLADQWTMRAEYRYTHFLDKTLSSSSPSSSMDNAGNVTTVSDTSQTGISADSHIVRFGVARAFGW